MYFRFMDFIIGRYKVGLPNDYASSALTTVWFLDVALTAKQESLFVTASTSYRNAYHDFLQIAATYCDCDTAPPSPHALDAKHFEAVFLNVSLSLGSFR